MNQTVLLGDIADLKGGFAFRSKDYTDSGRFVLRTVNIGDDGSIHRSGSVFISENNAKSYERFELRVLDTLFVMVGATLGKTGLVRSKDLPALLNQNMWVIRAKPEIVDPLYLYYLFSVESKKLLAYSSGAARDFVRRDDFRKMRLNIPDLKTQKKIADILGTIDEKIELNRRMNETLEQMGQALFRHYFIDNSEADDWGETRVGEIAEVTDYVANGSFASLKANVTLYDEPKYALFVRTTDFKGGFNGSLKYTDKKSYEFLKKSTLFGGEFIISNVGDTGTVFRPPVWLGKPMTLGSNAIMIKDSEYNNYLYQYFRSNEGQFAISNIVAGSAQPKFNKTEFRNLRIKRPDAASLSEFNVQFRTIEDGVFSNIAQIQTLTTLRDTLLPRLINEKIRL